MKILRRLWFCAAMAGAAACRRGDAAVIDRQRFVDTYVDLRISALASPGRTLPPAERERVLREHGVTADDLLHFVDVKGADPDYMVRLWTEIATRVPLSPLAPSAGLDSAGG